MFASKYKSMHPITILNKLYCDNNLHYSAINKPDINAERKKTIYIVTQMLQRHLHMENIKLKLSIQKPQCAMSKKHRLYENKSVNTTTVYISYVYFQAFNKFFITSSLCLHNFSTVKKISCRYIETVTMYIHVHCSVYTCLPALVRICKTPSITPIQ